MRNQFLQSPRLSSLGRRGGNPLAAYKVNDVLPLVVADLIEEKYFDPEVTTLSALLSPERIGLATMTDSTRNTVWTRHNMWPNSTMDGGISGSPGTAPSGLLQYTSGSATTVYGASSVAITVSAGRFQLAYNSISAAIRQVIALEVDVDTPDLSGNLSNFVTFKNAPSGAVLTYFVDGVEVLFSETLSAGSYTVKVVATIGATAGTLQARFGAGIDVNATADGITFSNPRVYDDSLAMADEAALGTCVDTISGAVYEARTGAYGPPPDTYWIGDSFLNGDGPVPDFVALINTYGHVGYAVDGVGGSSLADQATRFASAVSGDATIADRTLIILDGGLTDTASAAKDAIDDMVALLNHDRWLVVQSAPFYDNNSDGVQEKWAAIEAHVGPAHWVSTYEEAQAESDGSPEDLAEIALEKWPLSLKVSDADDHPNDAGKAFLADVIHAKAVGNGYLGNSNYVELKGALFEGAETNILLGTKFCDDVDPPDEWLDVVGTGTKTATTLYGVAAINFAATTARPYIRQVPSPLLSASTEHTFSGRLGVVTTQSAPSGKVLLMNGYGGTTGDYYAVEADIGSDGYIEQTFTLGTDNTGDIRIGIGLEGNVTGEIIFSELQLVESGSKSSWIPTINGTATRAADDPNITLPAATYDVRVIANGTTTDLDGVVHAGGDYWPTEATGFVSRVAIYPDGTF